MTSGKRQFLSPERLDKGAAAVLEAAKKERVDVAIGGGYALQIYGSPRLTGDVDIVADAGLLPGELHRENVLSALHSGASQARTTNLRKEPSIPAMPRYHIVYYDTAGEEHPRFIKADDLAAALGVIIDEEGLDEIVGAIVQRVPSPFGIEAQRRRSRGKYPRRRRLLPLPDTTPAVHAAVQELLQKLTGCSTEKEP